MKNIKIIELLAVLFTMILSGLFMGLIISKNKAVWSRLTEKGKKTQKIFLIIFSLLFIAEIIVFLFVLQQ